MKRLLALFQKRKKRKVLVHCYSGDIILPVLKGEIIHVPWMESYCPFHLEPDGSVTLRLVWDEGKAKGYGKVWDSITWENLKTSERR